ncbi:hypothetical protein GCM10010399_82740 [Dactylosporangium fulvum]|uniref:Uncharacterized protein n=1 Tax=Dactylosporangium fulvum TaxID=53359 RepID=A0ABY5W759_9ACTN|nr:hypothetical protein [Dactylosporangium fulvum]UWP85855.1 hypothetical protein Dfulv_17050 [Dactylosporangium fulvum]
MMHRYTVHYSYDKMADWSHLIGSMPIEQKEWMTTHHGRAVIDVDRPIGMADADEVARRLAAGHGDATNVTVTSIEPGDGAAR